VTTDFNEGQLPEELHEIAARLQEERPEASALELDRAKLKAMARGSREQRARERHALRPRAASMAVAAALLISGVAWIGGGAGGLPSVSFTQSKSQNSEYCPESSQQPGKPKDPGPSKCGKDK
jgi:hypothetical protein